MALGLVYQSRDILFPEWISLITLGLAPVIVHIVSGVPSPTNLTLKQPRWHDNVAHYNPVSILWRYAAITDRRIRARTWSPLDMAAANAVFWTASGWDGSEDMACRSVLYCAALPRRARVMLLSWTSIKTIVVTLQGVQAIYNIMGGGLFRLSAVTNLSFALDSIFFFFAFWSLLRLWAALWLTDDFAYALRDDTQVLPLLLLPVPAGDSDIDSQSETRIPEQPATLTLVMAETRFRPSSYWPSRIFRTLYMAPLFGVWLISLLYLSTAGPELREKFSTTSFAVCILGAVGTPGLILIYGYYAVRFGCTSTLIPCIGATWYKVFTGVFAVPLILLFICSAIETRRAPCGKYTTKSSDADWSVCAGA